MAREPKERNQQIKQPAGAIRSDVARRGLRLAVLPSIAVAALVGLLIFNDRDTTETTPVNNEASSVHTTTKEQVIPMQNIDDKTTRQPVASESVQDDGDGSTTEVTVNGERVTVPENGSYHRTTDDGGTRTDINVDSRQSTSGSGSGSSSSSSKVRINVQSNSTSESVSN